MEFITSRVFKCVLNIPGFIKGAVYPEVLRLDSYDVLYSSLYNNMGNCSILHENFIDCFELSSLIAEKKDGVIQIKEYECKEDYVDCLNVYLLGDNDITWIN